MARFSEWCPELEAALAAPFPSEWHKTKSQGGASITFVEWHRYAATLNELVGPQGWEVRLRFHDVGGKLVTVTGLSILGVLKENVGDEDEDKDSYGTACTNSFAQSYKRAAALFGLGLYMYDKAGRESATRSQRRAPNPPQSAVRVESETKQPWDKVMPFGDTKGKRLMDHTDDQLKGIILWCQKEPQRAEKFADLIQACADTIDHRALAA